MVANHIRIPNGRVPLPDLVFHATPCKIKGSLYTSRCMFAGDPGMSLTKQQALDLFNSNDLIGIGMEANALRRKLHPEGVATYVIDRNINYTNFCTEYCTFCAFYRPLKGPAATEGYILDFDTIHEKIRETVELGGTGVLMQGGLHPDLKIDWHEKLLRGIKNRFPQIHLHFYSPSH